MEQILLDPELLNLLYTFRPLILEHFTEQNPDIYLSGDAICCCSKGDKNIYIYGYGHTPQLAIEDWDKHFSIGGSPTK